MIDDERGFSKSQANTVVLLMALITIALLFIAIFILLDGAEAWRAHKEQMRVECPEMTHPQPKECGWYKP